MAVLPVRGNFKIQGSKFKVTERSRLNRQRSFPIVFYVYGSGGDLINCGNELRQLAELGMAAIAIEYNQTNEAAFEEQFVAAHDWVGKQKFCSGASVTAADIKVDLQRRSQTAATGEAWIGFSLGAQRTLSLYLKALGAPPTAAGGTPALPLPQLYVRLAGGMVDEFKDQGSKFKVAGHSTLNPQPSTLN